MSSSVHANDRAHNILVLGKDFIQEINGTTIYAEKMYSTNFTMTNKKNCLSLRYNGGSSYLYVKSKEIINFKARDSEIVPHPLCLGNVSKDFSLLNTTNIGLYGSLSLSLSLYLSLSLSLSLYIYIYIYIYMTLLLIMGLLQIIKY